MYMYNHVYLYECMCSLCSTYYYGVYMSLPFMQLTRHYHPSVQVFAKKIVSVSLLGGGGEQGWGIDLLPHVLVSVNGKQP